MAMPKGGLAGTPVKGYHYKSAAYGWYINSNLKCCGKRIHKLAPGPECDETERQAKVAFDRLVYEGLVRPPEQPKGYHYRNREQGWFAQQNRTRLTFGPKTPETEIIAVAQLAKLMANGRVSPIGKRRPCGLGKGRRTLMDLPTDVKDTDLTADSPLLDAFCVYKRRRLRNASQSSVSQHHINITRFGKFLGKVATVADLTNDNVEDCAASMVESGLAPATALKFEHNILALWRFLCKKGVLKEWPEIQMMKQPKRTPQAWMRGQMDSLWQEIDDTEGWIGDVPANLWWRALHMVMWNSGERVTALMQLKWCEVDLEGGWIHILAETRKGKGEDKLFRLHPEAIKALRMIVQPERELVFPWPFSELYLWTRYKKIVRSAGLPFDRKHMFHCIRKSVASYFEEAGGNATELLGHSSRRITKMYLDPRIVTKKHAADMLFQPGCPEVPVSQAAQPVVTEGGAK